MSSWGEDRRLNMAAQAAERRNDEAARDERRHANREAEDQRRRDARRKDREEKRAEQGQKRRDKLQKRQGRAARRAKLLTPGSVYQRGTLGLIGFSAAASLPAQIMHFVGISWMLFPIGPAVEGAAWVMAAGVAYADEKKLAPWVRWLLRALSLSAAMFAANINYQYGTSLAGHGLSGGQAQTAGLGLAAVTIGGPLFFEVRQWVLTMSASVLSPKQQADAKARDKHAKDRAKAFPQVADRARQLVLAAPYGTLKEEDAFEQAWTDIEGAPVSVTADSILERLEAEKDVARVMSERERAAIDLFLAETFRPDGGDDDGSGSADATPGKGPHSGPSEGRISLERKGKRPVRGSSSKTPNKPLAKADLRKVRKLADALGGPERLSTRNVRDAVGGGATEYLVRLRRAVQEEAESTTREEGDEK